MEFTARYGSSPAAGAGWFWRAFALEATVPLPNAAEQELVFDFAPVRDGYGWIFPKGDHINIGLYSYASDEKIDRTRLAAYIRDRCGDASATRRYRPVCGLRGSATRYRGDQSLPCRRCGRICRSPHRRGHLFCDCERAGGCCCDQVRVGFRRHLPICISRRVPRSSVRNSPFPLRQRVGFMEISIRGAGFSRCLCSVPPP